MPARNEKDIRQQYEARYDSLVALAERLEEFLRDLFHGTPRVDRISSRAKGIDSFVSKALTETKGVRKYADPLAQIYDQLGARIVVFYTTDANQIDAEIDGYFRSIERERKEPESPSEFGYVGTHYLLHLPPDIETETTFPFPFFELQVKTLFQHAWSEANHDLGYKSEQELSLDHKRHLAFTAAQAWGADVIFDRLLNTPRP